MSEETRVGSPNYAITRNGRKYDSGFESLAIAIQHARILSEEHHRDTWRVIDGYGQCEFETVTNGHLSIESETDY